MRLAVKLCVILVILASICEVNDAKKRGGSRPSSSSSGSRPSSGSSIRTRITNAFKPKKRPSGSRYVILKNKQIDLEKLILKFDSSASTRNLSITSYT